MNSGYTQHAIRLESGAVLPAAIDSAARELDLELCDVTGFGELQRVDLVVAGAAEPSSFDGPLDLLDLKGRWRRAGDVVLADFFCTVSRLTDNGIQLLGGRLVGAAVGFVELTLSTPVVAELAVSASLESGAAAAEDVGDSAPQTTAKPVMDERWAEALAESRKQQHAARSRGWDWEKDEEDARPKLGDIVDHRQFGRCKVVRLDDEHISLRKPKGRVVQLGLSILEFFAKGEEDGKPVFDVVVKRT